MIKKSGKPITGGRNYPSPGRENSTQGQKLISRPPSPFRNNNQTPEIPVGVMKVVKWGMPYEKPANVNPKPQSYGKRPMSWYEAYAASGYSGPEHFKNRDYGPNAGSLGKTTPRRAGDPAKQPKATDDERKRFPGIFGLRGRLE